MPETPKPVLVLPGQTLTVHDIHRLLPRETVVEGDKLVAKYAFSMCVKPKEKPAPRTLRPPADCSFNPFL